MLRGTWEGSKGSVTSWDSSEGRGTLAVTVTGPGEEGSLWSIIVILIVS